MPPANKFKIISENISTVSDRLRAQTSFIIDLWSKRVRENIPGARHQDDVKLHNGLIEFLEALTVYLVSIPGTPSGERISSQIIALCKQHGHQRALATDYTLDQVIFEYRLLRGVILGTLNETVSISDKETSKILEAIDYGISEAAVAFSQIKSSDKQMLYREAKEDAAEQKIEKDYAKEETRVVRNERDTFISLVADLKQERDLREHFVAMLSHDLKNPLTAVRSLAELISRFSKDCRKAPKLAKQIIANIDRTDRMITDLLDTNRIQAGIRLPLTVEEVDLQKLIIQTINELAIVYGRERFIIHLNEEIKGFWSSDGLKRVIENLVTNAIKYGDQKTVIRISIWKDNQQSHVSVHNKGKAISTEDRVAIFTPFLRASTANSSGTKGWGLGLTLVKGIMEAHGGSVSVESSPEQGTTFQLNLPPDSRLFQALS